MNCQRCQMPLVAGTRFCNHCGSAVTGCFTCHSDGSALPADQLVCSACGWLRPLAPNYRLDPASFVWAQDGQAMATLRSIGPLMAAAKSISDSAGRQWIETTMNGIRLSERQFPNVYRQAVQAARILGLGRMPDVYLSGERMWEAGTYGSEEESFVVIGTALVNNFSGDDLLFLLAREMGHSRAGHALWKTVLRFLVGEQGPRRGMMSDGVLKVLSPTRVLEGAIEMPLLAWARQAEITADRAGLLAVASPVIARRTLLAWSLKSSVLARQINLEAWLEQEEAAEDDMVRLSEMLQTATPYITRRLKLMASLAGTRDFEQWGAWLKAQFPAAEPLRSVSAVPAAGQAVKPVRREPAAPGDFIRLNCKVCKMPVRVPKKAAEGRDTLNIKCPNPKCGKVFTLQRKKQVAISDE